MTVTVAELVRQGNEHVRARNFDQAIGVLEGALQREPGLRDAATLLGLSYLGKGAHISAERVFRDLVTSDPKDEESWYNLGAALEGQSQRLAHAIEAYETALRLRPDFPEAERRLARARRPKEPPKALSQLLDDKDDPVRDDAELAGAVVWDGRPWPSVTRGWFLWLLLTLLAPRLFDAWAESLYRGGLRDLVSWLWHVSAAVQPALILWLLVYAIARWLSIRVTLRERRIEYTSGVLTRRTVVLWYHEIDQQPELRQNLLERALGLATVRVTSWKIHRELWLPTLTGQPRTAPGRLPIGSLSVRRALEIIAEIRSRTLWERRRMIANFIT